MGDLSKDFSKKEFYCKCCGFYIPQQELIKKLQRLRNKVNARIDVNSGTRCIHHNIEVGGFETSSHLTGMAADITSENMFKLLKEALQIFKRVGISKTFIHVDIDDSKPQEVYWIY